MQRALSILITWVRRSSAVASTALPAIDLLTRLWLAQLFAMTGLAGLVDWHAALTETPSLAAAVAMHPQHVALLLTGIRLTLPPLLILGLATRLAALPLLALSVAAYAAHPLNDSAVLWALLAAWYVVIGPGPLSLDHLIARGIYDSALPLAPRAGRLLTALSGALRPPALLLLRCGIAFVLLNHGMAAHGPMLVLAIMLAAGLASRLATLPLLAVTGAATMQAASNQHLSWTVLLLFLAASGPGPLSLDALLAAWIRRRFAALMERHTDAPDLHHVVIVGGGFAGIAAARALRHAPCRITLIDQHNYHLFQPLLYQVATASLSPADIATPIRALFRDQPNIRVVLGRVQGIDPAQRTVSLAAAAPVAYDSLILATGARHAYFGNDAWERFAPGLKTLDDATAIRRRILLAFERAEAEPNPDIRRALLTFCVIGGGPTGVELAGAIAELARHGLAQEFRNADPASARVLLIQSGDRLLPSFPPALSQAAARDLQALGVEIRLGLPVSNVTASAVSIGVESVAIDAEIGAIGAEIIACATTFWAAGVAASAAATWLGAKADRAGRLIADENLTVPGWPTIFAVGDTALVNAWNGNAVPGLAPAAKQAGIYAAHVIRARLRGRTPPPPFRYHHAGSLATIGRRAAVADFGRTRVTGALAWWLWGAVHILFLAGARNRLVVAVQWFWAYLTFGRGIRLITGASTEEP